MPIGMLPANAPSMKLLDGSVPICARAFHGCGPVLFGRHAESFEVRFRASRRIAQYASASAGVSMRISMPIFYGRGAQSELLTPALFTR
jgi:hypothetical protein